jgi:hypothetical protein
MLDRINRALIGAEIALNEDNTAAVTTAQIKKAMFKHTTGGLTVRSAKGKMDSRYVIVRANKIDNEIRKKLLKIAYPKANVRGGDMDNISYGNISSNIISVKAEHWAKALGLKESYHLDEQVNPQWMPWWMMPDPDDAGYTPWLKRMHRFLNTPHMSRSFALGSGVNLNEFLPPGISMSGESIDQFNSLVTNMGWPPYWWTLPGAGQKWIVFISLFTVFALEYDLDDAGSLLEWIQYISGLYGLAEDLLQGLIDMLPDISDVPDSGPISVAPDMHGNPNHYKGPTELGTGRQYLYH